MSASKVAHSNSAVDRLFAWSFWMEAFRFNGCYCELTVKGGGGGEHSKHSLAMCVAQDVTFFDPNNGEYWFQTHDQFQTWFKQFVRITKYDAKYTQIICRYYNAKHG